jgi:DNA-binding NarL/FixJ family response regulator
MKAQVRMVEQEQLRVAIAGTDPAQRAQLARLLEASGHMLVDEDSDADVVLVLGDALSTSDAPVVALGGPDLDQAGHLPTDASPAQIEAALRAAAAGLRVRAQQRERFAPMESALVESPHAARLTPREIEVLTAISEGLGNKAIARRLSISLHTVKFHIESIFRKLEVRTRAEAVARGLQRLQL